VAIALRAAAPCSIAVGQEWELEIKKAVEQSAFFIPIVTPRAVNSKYCKFEFESFLAREQALGRNDLMFPILYITVAGLENEVVWRANPVLSIIARRQYFDWRPERHLDIHSTAARSKIGAFCRNIVDALNQSWISPEEHQRIEEAKARQLAKERRLQAEANQRAEDEQRQMQSAAEARQRAERDRAEVKRRAAEEESRRKAEAEAFGRAERERARKEEETKRSKEQDQELAFAAAKRADSINSIDAQPIWRSRGLLLIGCIVVAVLVGLVGIWATSVNGPIPLRTDGSAWQSAPAIAGDSRFVIKDGFGADGASAGPYMDASSAGECAQSCGRNPMCNVFAYNKTSGSCYLYSRADTKQSDNYVSGMIGALGGTLNQAHK
jgi:hypothetical protein